MASTISVETNGAVLRVDDSGTPSDGTALLFLHYWGGSSATWRKVVALLRDEARCVAVNQRGWGGSLATDGRYDLAAMADDVIQVMDRLDLRRVVLVGHSMGGKVAQMIAKSGPERIAGLVLVAPAPPTPMPVSAEVRAGMLQSYGSAEGVEQALAVLAGPSLPAQDRPLLVRDMLTGAPEAKREWTDHGMIADLRIARGDLTLPTTVLVGSLDQVEAPERLRAIFGALAPQVDVVELPGVGHLAPLEASEPIADACRAALAVAG